MVRVLFPQRCGGTIHNVGHTHNVQHRHIVIIVAKSHHIGKGDVQSLADAAHTDALVGKGGVDPVRPCHSAVRLFPSWDKPFRVRFYAFVQIHRYFCDLLRHLRRGMNDLIVVPDELDALEHSQTPLHQVGGILTGEHHFALPVAAGPQVVGDFFGQCTRHRILGDALFALIDHAAVLTKKHTAVCHRCKELAQAGILPAGCRAKQNAAPMQLPYLFKDLAFQLFPAVLQQRTVNVAANQSD